MRFLSRRRRGVSSIVGSIFFILIMIVAIGSLVTMFNSFTAYNSQVSKAGNSESQQQDTELSVSSSSFGSFPPSTTSNYNVATGCTATTSTSPTNQGHLFYAAGMWWDFFTCNCKLPILHVLLRRDLGGRDDGTQPGLRLHGRAILRHRGGGQHRLSRDSQYVCHRPSSSASGPSLPEARSAPRLAR